MPKPSDFFLTIVSFLGVLLPGAVFVWLRGQDLRGAFFGPAPLTDTTAIWVQATVAAYVAGQILLAVSEILNGGVDLVTGAVYHGLYRELDRERSYYSVPANGPAEPRFRFHEALSRVRLRNATAAGEVDRHMADYKLFRNLVLIFAIDLAWSVAGGGNLDRILLDLGLALICLLAFARLHGWAELLALQYVRLIGPKEAAKIADA